LAASSGKAIGSSEYAEKIGLHRQLSVLYFMVRCEMKFKLLIPVTIAAVVLVSGCATPRKEVKPPIEAAPIPVMAVDDALRVRKYKEASNDHVIKHALQASRSAEASIDSLSNYLAPRGFSDLDQAWSIFVWMGDRIAYDEHAYLSGQFRDVNVSPEEVLRNRQTVCDGFTKLYMALAKRAGLEVMTTEGYAKAYGVKAGEVFSTPNHAWLMLKVGQTWQQLDPTWGAGYIFEGKYTKQLDPDYFLGQMEELKFTHWPLDERVRKTLAFRLTKAQFEAQPTVDPGLFRAGVKGHEVSEVIAQPDFKGLVSVFEQNHHGLRVISIPLSARLHSKKSYKFQVEASAFDEVVLMHDGGIYRLERSGTMFAGELKPSAGSLLVAGRPSSGGRLSGLFQYVVD
jgi:hypothetical protein